MVTERLLILKDLDALEWWLDPKREIAPAPMHDIGMRVIRELRDSGLLARAAAAEADARRYREALECDGSIRLLLRFLVVDGFATQTVVDEDWDTFTYAPPHRTGSLTFVIRSNWDAASTAPQPGGEGE